MYLLLNILQVRAATDGEMQSLADELLSCGYTGPINAERKDPITRFLVTLILFLAGEPFKHVNHTAAYALLNVGHSWYLSVRTIILHSLARLLPMLDQMRKGLQLYNLPDMMEKNIDLCRPLFVPLQDNKVKSNR